jgi:hypothetical protein
MVLPVLADEQPVLIVNCTSKIEQVDSLGVRKISLGLTMTHSGERLWPVLNEVEVRAKKVFLQNVVSMSDITGYRTCSGSRCSRVKPNPSPTRILRP